MACSRHWIAPLLVIAALGWTAVARGQGGPLQPQPVEITLAAKACADGPIVRLGHVARLEGGDDSVREALARLDVAELVPGKDVALLSRNELKFRILLAGHESRRFRLTGALKCSITQSHGMLTETAMLKAARHAVIAQVPSAAAERMVVTPVGPVALPLMPLGPKDKVTLQAECVEHGEPNGRAVVDVSIFVNGQPKASVRTLFEIRSPGGAPGSSEPGVAPRVAPGKQISPDDDPVLVKMRDRVRLIIQVGPVQVIATGESLQDGRLGQSIRVRNVDTNKILQGRVRGSELIEVEY